jgi:hypothetical protein
VWCGVQGGGVVEGDTQTIQRIIQMFECSVKLALCPTQMAQPALLLDLPDDIFLHKLLGSKERGHIAYIRDLQAVSRTCKQLRSLVQTWTIRFGSDAHKLYLAPTHFITNAVPMRMYLNCRRGHLNWMDVAIRGRNLRIKDVRIGSFLVDACHCYVNKGQGEISVKHHNLEWTNDVLGFPGLVQRWAYATIAAFFTGDTPTGCQRRARPQTLPLWQYFSSLNGNSGNLNWLSIRVIRNPLGECKPHLHSLLMESSAQHTYSALVVVEEPAGTFPSHLWALELRCAKDWPNLLYQMQNPFLSENIDICVETSAGGLFTKVL